MTHAFDGTLSLSIIWDVRWIKKIHQSKGQIWKKVHNIVKSKMLKISSAFEIWLGIAEV